MKKLITSDNLIEIEEENKIMKCTKCGQELKKEDRFCPACGSKVEAESYENKCNKCGRVLNSEDIFCPNCGEKNRQNYLLDKIHRYIEGNMDAFSDIYNETYSDIKAVCYAKFAGQPEEVDDMVQNSYIRIANKMYTYDASKGQFLAWARRVAANECNAELRKNKVKVTHIEDMKIDADDDKVVEFEDDHWEFNPEAHYAKTEREQMINEIISKIPEKQRECIVLYCMEQMKEEEIAEILEIPKGTVKSRIFNARKNIMAEVEDMKKRGINLFGMAPVVFFAWLLVSKKEAFAAEADAGAMYKKIKDQSKEKTNDRKETTQKEKLQHTAQKGRAETVGKTVAGATGKGIVSKIIAGAVTVAVLGAGGYIGYTKYRDTQNEKIVQNQENKRKEEKKEGVKEEKNRDNILNMKKIEDKTYTTGIQFKKAIGDSDGNIASLKKYKIDSGYFNAKEVDLDQDGSKELLVIKNNGLTTVASDYPDYVYNKNGYVSLALEIQVYEKKGDKWKLTDKTEEYQGEDGFMNHSTAIYLSESNELFIESYHLSAAFEGEAAWNIKGYQYKNEKLQPIYFDSYWNSEEVAEQWNQETPGIERNITKKEKKLLELVGNETDEFPGLKNALSNCMKKYGMDIKGWKYTDGNGNPIAMYKSVPGISLLFSEEVKTEKTIEELDGIWESENGLYTTDREALSKEFGNVNIVIDTSGKIISEDEENVSSEETGTDSNEKTNDIFTDEQLKYIREELKVPDSKEMEVTIGEPYYQDSVGMMMVNVAFSEKEGNGYASADVDVDTGKQLMSIYSYTE